MRNVISEKSKIRNDMKVNSRSINPRREFCWIKSRVSSPDIYISTILEYKALHTVPHVLFNTSSPDWIEVLCVSC